MDPRIIEAIIGLLPGFLVAWVFYGLTAHARRETFERIVEALIFTFLIKGLTVLVRQKILYGTRAYDLGLSSSDANLIWSMVLALVVGLILAALANRDVLHAMLRKCKVTTRTSLPSEWYSALRRGDRWMVLHLSGGRRLHGWAEEWPDRPDAGHFLMLEPKWLLDTGETVEIFQTYRMIVKASDVEMVEQVHQRSEVAHTDEAIAEHQKPLQKPQLETPHGNTEAPIRAVPDSSVTGGNAPVN